MNNYQEKAVQILKKNLVIRGHADVYEMRQRGVEGEKKPIEDSWLPRLEEANVDFVILAVSGDSVPHKNGDSRSTHAALDNLDQILKEMETSEKLVKVTSIDDVLPLSDGKTRFLLSLEGGSGLEGSLGILRHFYRLGIRLLQITHNVRNELADGGHEEATGGGLSRFGIEVVKECNRLGIVVDLAHLSTAGFWQTLELSSKPVIVSHGNCKALQNHPRNLSDDQIKAIAQKDGVLGMLFIPDYVNDGFPQMSVMLNHVSHVLNLVGVEHLSIGHLGLDVPLFSVFKNVYAGPYKGYGKFMREDFKGGINEREQFIEFVAALLEMGVSENDVIKILGANLRRVFSEVFAS